MLVFAALVIMITLGFRRFEDVWLPFLVAFSGVFLAGVVSLAVTCGMRKQYGKSVSDVLTATLLRAMIVAATLGIVIVTQSKEFVIDVFCLTIVFYLGMLPVHVWLTMPGKNIVDKQLKL